MTMRQRPFIINRRKLSNDQSTTDPPSQCGAFTPEDTPKPAVHQGCPDGVGFVGCPSMSAAQVVVIPKPLDLQRVITVLTAKHKECGAHGPNLFILADESSSCSCGSPAQTVTELVGHSIRSTAGQPAQTETLTNILDVKPVTAMKSLNKEEMEGPLDYSLSNVEWLRKRTTCSFEPDPPTPTNNKKNQNSDSQISQAHNTQTNTAGVLEQPMPERPPYSFMVMIQFAINSSKSRRMRLKEIYTWIEDHFPYFKDVAKKGWKNSVRHNLSRHDIFIRETSADGKVSFWTIRPEVNRFLTLDQTDPTTAPAPVSVLLFPDQQPKRLLPDSKETPTGSEGGDKPVLPPINSYLVPTQLPVASSVLTPPFSSSQCTPSRSLQKSNISHRTKRVWVAPKVTQADAPSVVIKQQKEIKREVEQEPISVPKKCKTPKALSKRAASSSQHKQHLVHSLPEEPLLLRPSDTILDSDVDIDTSAFHDMRHFELDQHQQPSPDQELSLRSPIKSSSHMTSSTPPSNMLSELWTVMPVGKGSQSVVQSRPVHTPSSPTVSPQCENTTNNSPLFDSPSELLTSAPSTAAGPAHSPMEHLHGGGTTPMNRSPTEGFVLDTMNGGLTKTLLDISFSGLNDENLVVSNISWSEFIS